MTIVPKFSIAGQGSSCGRRGMPAANVAVLYSDYLALRSLAKVGARHGRSRQSVFDTFARRGLPLYARRFKDQIEYRGRRYTLDGQGYYRDTIWRQKSDARFEAFLHRRVWQDAHGKIPAGHDVGFKDRNRQNCALENLVCLPHAEFSAFSATGENGSTKSASRRLALMLKGTAAAKLKRA